MSTHYISIRVNGAKMYTTIQKIPALQLFIATVFLSLVTGQAVAQDNAYLRSTENDAVPEAAAINRDNLSESSKSSRSPQEMLRLGERMYREGILPSGEAMQGYIKGDITVNGTSFSCASCHMHGGLGSIEGGVTTPPTTGNKLFKPFISGTIFTTSAKTPRNHYVINPSLRPAYTQKTLAYALRGGINPAGNKLDDVMPRYHLQDQDMAILLNYLGSLSANFSPGVDNTTLRLATIITDDVSPEDRKAMLEPLENFVAFKNSQAKVYATRAKYMRGGGFPEEMDLAYRKLSLSRWELKGRPETWRDQLEELNRKEPVFAFIGGITTGEWKPFHEFSEAHKIPSLFPFTEFPVISDTNWYTLYFSKGLYQEGEAAARFLDRVKEFTQDTNIVQIVSNSRESRTLSAGFMETWREMGNKSPVTISLNENEAVSSDLLLQLNTTHKPTAILLWTGPEILPALNSISKSPTALKFVFASSGYLKKDIWNVPEKARGITYITYPYRLPQELSPDYGTSPALISSNAERNNDQRISTKAQAITEVLQLGLLHMNRNYYRDTFLDVISMIPDQTPLDYERLSFGPGQRYASKGCNIVQLTEGANPVLVKKSDWVIH